MLIEKFRNIGVVIFIALIAFLVYHILTNKLQRALNKPDYYIELQKDYKVNIKSEYGDVYITTLDSIPYYIQIDQGKE